MILPLKLIIEILSIFLIINNLSPTPYLFCCPSPEISDLLFLIFFLVSLDQFNLASRD